MRRIQLIFTILFTTIATMATAQIDRSKQPQSGPTPSINLGEPKTYKLPNGLTLLVVENHKLPRVAVQLTLDELPVLEGDKAGISQLISYMLGNGTTTIPKDKFNEEIDYLAAYVTLSPDGGYMQSLSKYFPRVLELMADAALHPMFTQEELDKNKAQLLQELKAGESSAAAIAQRVQRVLRFSKKHPYGEYVTEASLKKITLKDVKDFYQRHFVPNNAYMVVTGDVNPTEVESLVSKYFKDWKPVKTKRAALFTPEDVKTTEIDFVDLDNAVQSEIRITNLIDLKMKDKDYFPLLIANSILGGDFGSYINMNLREKHGYTYGASSSFNPNKWTKGAFGITTQVRNAVTDSAVVEVLKEIKRIQTEDVSDEKLAQAKAQYLGQFIMATEKPQTTARYAINIKTQGLPADFYKNYIANINAVTKEDVKRVANKYFKANNLRIIVVGKGAEVAKALEQVQFEGKKIGVKQFDKYGEAQGQKR